MVIVEAQGRCDIVRYGRGCRRVIQDVGSGLYWMPRRTSRARSASVRRAPSSTKRASTSVTTVDPWHLH
jgi:hypothetical protein